MKIVLQREELLNPLQIVASVVERRQTLPILANVLLDFDKGSLALTATDMEIELSATAKIGDTANGQVTLPARKLLDICRSLPENCTITFEVKDNQTLIKSGKSRFTLMTLPAKDFPALEQIDAVLDFTIKQSALRQVIGNTQFAMAQQDVRYYLNGLLLEMTTGQVRAVATDGHRLALSDVAAELTVEDGPLQVIVPRKGVTELARFLENSDTDVAVSVASNHIRFKTDAVCMTCKLIDGRFPDYDRVLPDESSGAQLLANREALRQSLTRASILSNEKYRGVRLALTTGLIRALAHNPEQEEAEEEIEVDYSGDDIEIGFNVNYLLDAISAVSTDQVRMSFYDSNTSCLIRPDGQDNSRYVVMPMRL